MRTLEIGYKAIEEDHDIKLLGPKNKIDFLTTTKEYRNIPNFMNDTFKKGKFGAQFNIVKIARSSTNELITFFHVRNKDDKLLEQYINFLSQSVTLGSKYGLTSELQKQTSQFEKRFGIENSNALNEYSKYFSNLRNDIARINSKLYYAIFASSLTLTFPDKLTIQDINYLKINPLEKLNNYSLEFFEKKLI